MHFLLYSWKGAVLSCAHSIGVGLSDGLAAKKRPAGLAGSVLGWRDPTVQWGNTACGLLEPWEAGWEGNSSWEWCQQQSRGLAQVCRGHTSHTSSWAGWWQRRVVCYVAKMHSQQLWSKTVSICITSVACITRSAGAGTVAAFWSQALFWTQQCRGLCILRYRAAITIYLISVSHF